MWVEAGYAPPLACNVKWVRSLSQFKSHFFIFEPIFLGDYRLDILRVGHFCMRFAYGHFWLNDDKILYVIKLGENGDKTQVFLTHVVQIWWGKIVSLTQHD